MTESARIAQGVVIHGLSSWMGPVELFAFIYLFTLDLERRARLVLGLFLTVLRETSVFPGWIGDDGLFAKRSALPFFLPILALLSRLLVGDGTREISELSTGFACWRPGMQPRHHILL